MKVLSLLILCLVLVITASVFAQSGRKSTKLPPPPQPVNTEPAERPKPPERDRPQVAAVTGEEYKCTQDGSLGVVVHSAEAEKVFTPSEVTTKAGVHSRPKPEYTREARRKAVEGIIVVRAVLSASGKVSSVKILKGLPFGLNENAIHAACKIEFTPATKDGQPVSQSLKTEYTFRLESSIFRP